MRDRYWGADLGMGTGQKLILAGALLYLLVPGHPRLPFSGIPIGPSGVLAGLFVAVAIIVWGGPPRSARECRFTLGLLACVILAKGVLSLATPPTGWLGFYYANPELQGPHEVSTDFPGLHGTRLDPVISFEEDRFPVHFFNDVKRFNWGFRREFIEPFSIRWLGHVRTDEPVSRTVSLTARGYASLKVDGEEILVVESGPEIERRTADLSFGAGRHVVEVGYRKPADTNGLVDLAWDRGGGWRPWGAPEVSPVEYPEWHLAVERPFFYVALLLHVVMAGSVFASLTPFGGRHRVALQVRDLTHGIDDRVLYLLVLTLFSVQGFWRSSHLIGKTWTLSGGDDWLAYEGAAREILVGGLLMTYGAKLGEGDPYNYYPLYSYFIAAIHWLTGEELFGVIFVQFLLLALTTVVIHKVSKEIFGAKIATLSLLSLVVIEQVDFVRWYTVTLLSENLYFLTVAVTVYCLVRSIRTGNERYVVAGGLCGGISALTRPSMMLYLIPSTLLVGGVTWTRSRRPGLAARRAMYYAAWWLSVVGLATVRNYVVSGQSVMITAGQTRTFITYNLPSVPGAEDYMAGFTGGLLSAFAILGRILIDHPWEYLHGVFVKVMFSLGLVHWMGGTDRAHPELILSSVGYLASVALCAKARSAPAWLLHFFILSHLATMTLTMPSNYGYRLILPMYLFIPVFASVSAVAVWTKGREWASRRVRGAKRVSP